MSEPDAKEELSFAAACRFVIKLGTLAHGYGPQAQRLESYLARLTKALGYNGIFASTPTSLAFTFIKKNDEPRPSTQVVSLPGTGFNLAKLAQVGELVTAVEAGQVSLVQATEVLDQIDSRPPSYGNCTVALGYALCGAGFAGFLRGSWGDIFLAAVFSVAVFGMVAFTEHSPRRPAPWTPFLYALGAGVLAATANFLWPGIQAYLVTLSAIIYLIPGFSISVGVIELTNRHVHSGLANLAHGLLSLVLLFAGAWVGITWIGWLLPVHGLPYAALASDLVWLFAMLLSAGLCLAFQTPPRDLLWALAGCAVACVGIVLGERIQGGDLGNFLGTALAIIFANIWSDKTNRPTSIVLLPAFVFMVSGSIGFRGLVAISAGNSALGLQEFIHMFVVAITLALGLVVGNSVYKPQIML